MPEVREFQTVVGSAERAANTGDFAKAEELLRVAVALQESTVGPGHPDLAATLNNLAVACERAGHPEDAELFYRRAYSVAAAALGPRHPLVVTSRDNLRDFCHARGLPVDDWALGADDTPDSPAMPPGIAPLDSSERSLDAFGPSAAASVVEPTPVVAARATPSPAAQAAASAPPPRTAPPHRAATAAPLPAAPAPRASAPPRPNPGSSTSAGSGMRPFAIALAIVAVIGTAAVARLWFSPGPAAPPVSDRTARASAAPATPTAETPAAATTTSAPPPAPAPAPAPSAASADAAETPSTAAGDVRVVTASVCASLSTSGGAWRCDAVDDASQPGRYSYYTRVAAPRALRVRHRWYQGDRLRQDVTLAVAANASAGYRTFSRQTVSAGAWRVEMRDDNGALLDESRFVVR